MPSLEMSTPPVDLAASSPKTGTASDLVTLIITTSPTPSAPSTELISAILHSFEKHCPALGACRVILVLDTFDRIDVQARLKRGQVTAEGAHCFDAYKENAKNLILNHYRRGTGDAAAEGDVFSVSYGEAEYGASDYAKQTNAVPYTITSTSDGHITFIEPDQRLGFGLAVRSALRLTKTPYVWVQQHDWALVSDIPLAPLLDLMQRHADPELENVVDMDSRRGACVPIKYVCFPSIRMLKYATSDHVMLFPGLRALTNLYKQNFSPPHAGGEGGAPPVKIPLTPLFLWHDKPHLAETEHYLARIFPNRLAMARGAFIEDSTGNRARTEMKDGKWKKWACWLYYPDEGKRLCLRHLKGRHFRGAEAEMTQRLEWMRIQALGAQKEST